jgi:hypothetical protein
MSAIMTEDEKRNQKAMLLLEYQEAEQELAHLKTKASKLVENIDRVREWLNNAARGNRDDKARFADANIRATFQSYSEALQAESLLCLVDEINKVKSKVDQLAAQKTSLGLK